MNNTHTSLGTLTRPGPYPRCSRSANPSPDPNPLATTLDPNQNPKPGTEPTCATAEHRCICCEECVLLYVLYVAGQQQAEHHCRCTSEAVTQVLTGWRRREVQLRMILSLNPYNGVTVLGLLHCMTAASVTRESTSQMRQYEPSSFWECWRIQLAGGSYQDRRMNTSAG